MISRWKDVAKKTAEELGLPEEEVIEYILYTAKKIAEHASHPTAMETDVFGLGAFCASYGKLVKTIPHHERRIGFQKRLLERHIEDGYEPGILKATRAIQRFEEDLVAFERFISIKYKLSKGKKRAEFGKEYIKTKGNSHERVKVKRKKIKKVREQREVNLKELWPEEPGTTPTPNRKGRPSKPEPVPGAEHDTIHDE